MSQQFKALAIFAFLVSFIPGLAQTPGSQINDLNVNSPYSRVGIGDLNPSGNLRNIGMAFTGVSYGNPEFINLVNPALLINNRVRRYDSLTAIFEASGMFQFRNIKSNATSQWTGNLNYHSFTYALPVNKYWTTSVGIRPFSEVSYLVTKVVPITQSSDSTILINNGHGGINRVDFTNGVKINKNISIGLQATYLFGTIYEESFSQIIQFVDSLRVGITDRTHYSGFLFNPGIALRKSLDPRMHADSAVFVNFGFTYQFFVDMIGEQKLLLQRKDRLNEIIDQSTVSASRSNLTFPSTYKVGLSFDKHNDWNVAVDFSYSDWTKYKVPGQLDTLKSSFTIALGGEKLVNFKKDRTRNENWNFKKNYARAGISYTKTPMFINGKQINDVALTLGYTLSVGNIKTNYLRTVLPKLNLALVIGQRGTLERNLVKDLYFKAYVGMTINDKWFRRRRID